MREVVSQDNFVFDGGSILDNEEYVPVERDGYRTLDEQLQSFREAGERLTENRRYEYQHDEDFMETELSVLETNDADLVDMNNAVVKFNEENKKVKIEKEKEEKEKAKKEYEEMKRKAEEFDKINARVT